MADSQMLEQLIVLTGESDESLLTALLSVAETKVLNRLYPFDDTKTTVPPKYEKNVLEIAVYLYNRRGSEGELSHDEGDISRSYASASVPEAMFAGIVPFCGVI